MLQSPSKSAARSAVFSYLQNHEQTSYNLCFYNTPVYTLLKTLLGRNQTRRSKHQERFYKTSTLFKDTKSEFFFLSTNQKNFTSQSPWQQTKLLLPVTYTKLTNGDCHI